MGTEFGRSQSRTVFRGKGAGIALLAAGLIVGAGGCGRSGGGGPFQSQLDNETGARLGALIAEGTEPGEVVLVHLSTAPGQAKRWINGLNSSLGGGFSVTECGPEQLPTEARGSMGGFPALWYALDQYPNAAAVITTLPVGGYENPRFAKEHPPIYALAWSYLPDSIYLFRGQHLVGGVFETPNWDPGSAQAPDLTPEERFARNYVVVTPENLRELAVQY